MAAAWPGFSGLFSGGMRGCCSSGRFRTASPGQLFSRQPFGLHLIAVFKRLDQAHHHPRTQRQNEARSRQSGQNIPAIPARYEMQGE